MRTVLLGLVLAVLLPSIAGAIILFVEQYRQGRADRENDLMLTARALSQAVDAQLTKHLTAGEVLAGSPHLANGNMAAFQREAEELVRDGKVGDTIVIRDASGQQLVNTTRSFGTPLARSDLGQLRQVLATGKPQVTNLFIGSMVKRPLIGIAVPVMVQGRVKYVLNINIYTDTLNQLLRNQNLPAEWIAGVYDRDGTIAARTHFAEEFIGKPSIAAYRQRLQEVSEGIIATPTKEGVESLIFFSKSSLSGWSVAVAIPSDLLAAQLYRQLTTLALGIALLFAIGIALAWKIGGRIGDSVRALAADANALGAGESLPEHSGMLAEARDVTSAMQQASRLLARRSQQLEEANSLIREREDLLRQVLDSSRDVVYRINVQSGKYEYMSQAAAAVIGYSPDELMAQSPDSALAMVHPDDLPKMLAALAQLDDTGTANAEYRVRIKSGGYRWLSNRLSLTRDSAGRPLYRNGNIRDITASKLAESRLAESNQRLQALMQAVPVGISFSDDITCQRITGNPTVLEQFAFEGDDNLSASADDSAAPGRRVRFFRDGREIDATELPLQRAIAENGAIPPMELEVRLPNGRTWFADVSGAPVRNAEGSVVAGLAVTVDVTARKRAEQALQTAKEAAESANNAKSRFLAAASHDLRQPLSALALYVNVLDGEVGAKNARLVDNIKACVTSLSELLTDLLDVSKLDAGVVTPKPRTFAVGDVLATLVAQHALEARIKGLQLRYRDTNLTACSDEVLYRRILNNILTNAIRYTECGGVLVGCRRSNGRLWVEIWDTGIGIPADMTEVIFEEFRQLGDQARNRGSGLGLAIVDKAAALLGLKIRVRSRPGKGSLFAVEVPLARSVAAESVMAESSVPEPLAIALVDDNALVLGALRCALESIGHRVVAATSGQALLAQLGGIAPDMVISDYRLAGNETGFDVIKATRAAFGEDLPAIIITGDTDPDLVGNMARRGILIKHKPVDIDALQRTIVATRSRQAAILN
ncbi:MAG: ATP-binding protein [Bacteroidota bacterium]